jgi:hypothetical protein
MATVLSAIEERREVIEAGSVLVIGLAAQQLLSVMVQVIVGQNNTLQQLYVWSAMLVVLTVALLLVKINLFPVKPIPRNWLLAVLFVGFGLAAQTWAELVGYYLIGATEIHHQLLFWIIMFFCLTTIALVLVGISRSHWNGGTSPRPAPLGSSGAINSIQPINKLSFRMQHSNAMHRASTLV